MTTHFQMSDLRPLMLLVDGRELLKVQTIEPEHHRFVAQVELTGRGVPPPRTWVRMYTESDLLRMRGPGAALMARYERAYGDNPLSPYAHPASK